MDTPIVKTCATCGFLAKVRTGMPSRTDTEPIDSAERETGNVGNAKAICKVSKVSGFSIEHEILAVYETNQALQPSTEVWIIRTQATKEVFDLSRDTCAGWTDWNQDLTPQEHYQEWRMLQLEKDRREWQERISKMEQELQLKAQQAQAKSDQLVIGLTIGALMLAVAQVLTMTKDSLLWSILSGVFRWMFEPWL